MKKLISLTSFLLLVLLLAPFAYASSEGLTMPNGASIRTTGSQGLRFYANLTNEEATGQGFYVIYGESSILDLENAITLVGENDIIVNGKKVFKVEVAERELNGDFSVVLTGIPEAGYLQKITAIAYAVVDGVEEFVDAGVTRSIGEVAFNMTNAGEYNQAANDILSVVDSQHSKLVATAWGTYEEVSALFEHDPFVLREEFIADWNAKFGTNWTILNGSTFNANAILNRADTSAIGAMRSLQGSNIHVFFQDSVYGPKWTWVLDLIIKYGTGTVHPARQAQAIKGDGTNNNNLLYNGEHFTYSLTNFFNVANQTTGYVALNFTLPGAVARYRDVINFNKGVLRNTNLYNIDKVGDLIVLPQELEKSGKTFDGVYSDGTSSNLVSYTLGQGKILTPLFTNIDYDINFFDDEEELIDLADTYTIDQLITLPTPTKEGYEFIGWYDNPGFTGSVITTIPVNSTGNKTYYAKFESLETYKVTFDFGYFGNHTKSKQDLFTEFATDYKAYFALDLKTVAQLVSDWPTHAVLSGGQTPMNFFNDSVYGLKWGWLKDFLQSESTRVSYAYNSNLFITPNEAYWRFNLFAFWTNGFRATWPVSMDFTNIDVANSFWVVSPYHNIILDFDENFAMIESTNILIWNLDYEFVGWYDAQVGGNLVTSIEELTENITLYARYALK